MPPELAGAPVPLDLFLSCLGDHAERIGTLRHHVGALQDQADDLAPDLEDLQAAFAEHQRRQTEAELAVNRRLLALEVAAGLARAEGVPQAHVEPQHLEAKP